MSTPTIPAALAIDHLGSDARAAFDIAADARYRAIAFPTNHPELTPDALGQSARRHLKSILSGKHLGIDAIRIAAPRAGVTDPATIDRTLENAQKAILLAHDLGVSTVSLHLGNVETSKIPHDTLVSALRELAQHADAAGLTLALGGDAALPLGGLLKRVDYDRARINLDTARMIAAGEDPLKIAEQLAGLIAQVTAADAVRAGNSVRTTFLGEGQLPLPEFMEILHDQGFHGPTVVDVRDLPNAPAAAHHAAQVLTKLLRP